MDKQLIKSLLRIYHNPNEKQNVGAAVLAFVGEFNIGRRYSSTYWFFDQKAKSEIVAILKSQENIDAAITTAEQWDHLSRSESLAHGSNEKMSGLPVREARLAVKSLLGQPLLLPQPLYLPDGANLDVDLQFLLQKNQHRSVLFVENWEVFEKIHLLNFRLDWPDSNPLVVFRGAPYVYRGDTVYALLKQLALPVLAFVDIDPKGMNIAYSLPHFSRLLVPDWATLETELKQAKNKSRYQEQYLGVANALEKVTHPDIVRCWNLLKRYENALPQEQFVRCGHNQVAAAI